MRPTKILTDRFFDGVDFVNEPHTVVVTEGTITSVQPGHHEATEGELAIDARGHTLLPGLINSHVHIARGGMFEAEEPIRLSRVGRNFRETLAGGVTTVGDMGCTAALIRALREHNRARPNDGPTIRGAGPMVTCPKGYPFDWLGEKVARLGVATPCATESDACRTAQNLAEQGMDFIKLAIMHRSYSDTPLSAVKPEVARALVEEAHKLGLKVLAHAHRNVDYEVALSAGVDALMHSTFDPLDEQLVERIADAGVPVCPTLWVFESVCVGAEERWDRDPARMRGASRDVVGSWRRFAEAYAVSDGVLPPGIGGGLRKERVREASKNALANLRLLRDAGVPIVFGDDTAYGFARHGAPVHEMLAMSRAGLSPSECLRAATSRGAELLGLPDRGRIAPGLVADLVVVGGDPSRDLKAIADVREVLVGGTRWLSRRASRLEALGPALAFVKGLVMTVAMAAKSQLSPKRGT